MLRTISALVAGFVVWGLVATLINFGLRAGLPGYTLAEPSMSFTLGMKVARLILGALASLSAGATVGLIAPSRRRLPWVLGAVIPQCSFRCTFNSGRSSPCGTTWCFWELCCPL